jgi:hypothetical protein
MSDPVDAVETTERVQKERGDKESAQKMRSSGPGSGSAGGMSGITKSSAGSKKKPAPAPGRKGH